MLNKLTLDKWERMLPSERENWAFQLVGELPSGFTFRSIRLYKLGTTSHHVAEFEFDGSSFVLIPGGFPLLGYDTNRAWEPTPKELESWQCTVAEYGIDCTIQEYIASVTLKPRSIYIPSLLMEATAQEVGWEQIEAVTPEIKEVVRERLENKSLFNQVIEVSIGNSCVRVQCDAAGIITTQKSCAAYLHGDFMAQLGRLGFRFPTSDEWEYACGAGVPTLFRWGDRVPCDWYPTDISPTEVAGRQWAMSSDKLECPPAEFSSDWDLHRQRNTFGIYIASNPYYYELVAEPEITRGGDGGSKICGGAGFFLAWLTLATAYFEQDVCRRNPTEPVDIGHAIGRRVLPLS